MKLTEKEMIKLNDFKRAFKEILNKNNDKYFSLVIDNTFINIIKFYEEFSDEVKMISVDLENDNLNIIKPVNGNYSLLDFLLNRAVKNIRRIDDNPPNNKCQYQIETKTLRLPKDKFEKYKKRLNSSGNRLFTDDFLYHQVIKAIMHESGHALQNKRECDVYLHELEDFARKINSILGNKYDLNTNFSNISGKCFISPFNTNYPLMEGINEMYASLFSGVLEYDTGNSFLRKGITTYNALSEDNGKKKTSLRRNCFTSYIHSKYFYIIRPLVSKRAIFNSLFLSKNDMLDEFYARYKDIIDKFEATIDPNIIKTISKNQGNFFERLLKYVSASYLGWKRKEDVSGLYKYENILDNILIEIYKKVITMPNTNISEIQTTLANAYLDAYSYIEGNKYVSSSEKEGYQQLYSAVKNKSGSKQTDKVSRMIVNPSTSGYGTYNVNMDKAPYKMKIMVIYRDGNFEITPINQVKNDTCMLIERYLNKSKQRLINNPSGVSNILSNFNNFIPSVTITRTYQQEENITSRVR